VVVGDRTGGEFQEWPELGEDEGRAEKVDSGRTKFGEGLSGEALPE